MKKLEQVKPFHTDDRGKMSYLSDGKTKVNDVLIMTCKKGAVRANHYHHHDTHHMYLIEGKYEYISRDMKKKGGPVKREIILPGQLVKTPPMIAHKVRYLEDSLVVVLTTEPRDQKSYEKDTVRLEVEDL